MSVRDTLLAIYDKVRRELYLCRDDLVINDLSFASTLLLQLLAFLVRGNILCLGVYGTGKTTAAEILSCVMTGFPLNAVIKSQIRGSPELTEEKVVGSPDLGKLN